MTAHSGSLHLRQEVRFVERKKIMKTVTVAGMAAAGVAAMGALAAGQIESTGSGNRREPNAVVDRTGNLRVPDGYRTTYQLLGSWAVAADHGQGSKELHVV